MYQKAESIVNPCKRLRGVFSRVACVRGLIQKGCSEFNRFAIVCGAIEWDMTSSVARARAACLLLACSVSASGFVLILAAAVDQTSSSACRVVRIRCRHVLLGCSSSSGSSCSCSSPESDAVLSRLHDIVHILLVFGVARAIGRGAVAAGAAR